MIFTTSSVGPVSASKYWPANCATPAGPFCAAFSNSAANFGSSLIFCAASLATCEREGLPVGVTSSSCLSGTLCRNLLILDLALPEVLFLAAYCFSCCTCSSSRKFLSASLLRTGALGGISKLSNTSSVAITESTSLGDSVAMRLSAASASSKFAPSGCSALASSVGKRSACSLVAISARC